MGLLSKIKNYSYIRKNTVYMNKQEQITKVKMFLEASPVEPATHAEVLNWCEMYNNDEVSEAQFKISMNIFLQVNLFP